MSDIHSGLAGEGPTYPNAPGQISQPNVFISFPTGGGLLRYPVASMTVQIERIASVIPLPGDSGTGKMRMFWVDLGLVNYNIILEGTIRDHQTLKALGSASNQGMAHRFMKAWQNSLFDLSSNVNDSDLTLVQIDDRTWGKLNYRVINQKLTLKRAPGIPEWHYYMRFAVIKPPDIGTYHTFTTVDPLGSNAHVVMGFPVVGGQTIVQANQIEINYDRQATPIPLPADDDENTPRFAYTDLGLAQPMLQIRGVFPDIINPNPFQVMEAFYRNWSGRITGDSANLSNVEGTMGVCIDDPNGSGSFFGIPNMMRLTREGGRAKYDYITRMWVTRADDAGI